ncbi:hypothetical protein BDL97_02G205500 [Sphagnum fallax]|nr:hypothetical protein BDL97_02G205500 [Sphagnum fallax]
MNYFLTTMLDFQPIIVGAGCLALGFVYGRHRRAMDQQPQQTAAGIFLEKSDEKLCNSSSSSVQPFHQLHPETHDEMMTRGPASSPTTPRMKTKMAAFENDDDDGRSRSSEESSPGEEDIIAADTRQQERCTATKRHLAQQVIDVLDRHSSGMVSSQFGLSMQSDLLNNVLSFSELFQISLCPLQMLAERSCSSEYHQQS